MLFFFLMKQFVFQRLSGKLIVLVPIKNSLAYESSEEGVDCDVCSEKIPIRQWALHIERCTTQFSFQETTHLLISFI